MKKLKTFTVALILFTSLCVLAPFTALSAASYDYRLHEVMGGKVPGLTVIVNGSGQGYYGDSIRATFSNQSSQGYYINVPIGLSLVPQVESVQTMYTAGNEILFVPPGGSAFNIKAFCGQANDSGPGSSDTFSAGGFADGDLMRTLEEINRQENYTKDAQDAVWHQTDGNDISNNQIAQDLTNGGGVSSQDAAAAGGATALTALLAVLIMNLIGNGGQAAAEATAGSGSNNYPPFNSSENEPLDDELPLELRPPIQIADIIPPEDPGEGILIAAAGDTGLEMIWQAILDGRNVDPQPPAERPSIFGPPPDEKEGFWDMIKRYLWDETPGRYDTPEESAAKDEANRRGGQTLRENTPSGSKSDLNKALSDPVQWGKTGDGDTKELIDQLKREQYEKGASDGLRWVRRFNQLKSATNSKDIQPNWSGPPSSQDLSKVLGPHQTARDLSGGADFARDFAEPDVKDWVTELIPVYGYDENGHQAMSEFYDKYGHLPDSNNQSEHDIFMQMYNRLRGK